jgi:hypothetical protein
MVKWEPFGSSRRYLQIGQSVKCVLGIQRLKIAQFLTTFALKARATSWFKPWKPNFVSFSLCLQTLNQREG